MGKPKIQPLKLVIPVVNEKELSAAKAAMNDKAKKKRENTNMHIWLEAMGKKDEFNALEPQEKKQFPVC